jgi:hypothetical protein
MFYLQKAEATSLLVIFEACSNTTALQAELSVAFLKPHALITLCLMNSVDHLSVDGIVDVIGDVISM